MISATTTPNRTAREFIASNAIPPQDGSIASAPTAANSFGKLLTSHQQLLTGSLHGDEKSSADLMFEPPQNEKDAAGHAAVSPQTEDEQDRSSRTHSKPLRSNRTSQSHGAHDSDSMSTGARAQNFAIAAPDARDRAFGLAPEQMRSSNANIAASKSIATRSNDIEAGTTAAQPHDFSTGEVNQNRESKTSAGYEENDSGRAAGGASTFSSSNASEIHSPSEFENETSPARQIGRMLAAPSTNEAKASVQEQQEVQLPAAQNSKQASQSQQSARLEASRNPSPDPTARSNAAESTKPTPFEQLVQSLRLRVGSKVSSAVMQLHPPQLGRMKIDVRAVGDQIRVAVETETQAARDRVNERASELRAALAQHGIDVRQFDVTVGPPVANPESYFAQGWSRSSDADRRESEWSMNQRENGPEMPGAAAGPIIAGFTAVGTTRLDVRV